MSKNEQKPPSILGMVKSFTKDLARYIKEGAPNVSPEDYAIRLDTCSGCEHFKKSSMRCGSCGCLLEHKAKWKTADCPMSKWPAQEQPPKDTSEDDKK